MKEINVKLNGYICVCYNLKFDVRIIFSYNFIVIEKLIYRSMFIYILKIYISKYVIKKIFKIYIKNFLRYVF